MTKEKMKCLQAVVAENYSVKDALLCNFLENPLVTQLKHFSPLLLRENSIFIQLSTHHSLDPSPNCALDPSCSDLAIFLVAFSHDSFLFFLLPIFFSSVELGF